MPERMNTVIRVFRDQGDKGGDVITTSTQGDKVEKTGWTSAVSNEIFDAHGEELVKHENINSVLKDYYTQKDELSKAIIKPGEKASEEEVNKYKESMGIPLKLEDYELGEIPDGATKDEEFDKWIKEKSLNLGLSKSQTKDFHKEFKALEATAIKAEVETKKAVKEKTEKEMRVKYGDEYDATMAKVVKIMDLGGTEFKARLKETGLDNDPGMVEVLAKLGSLISEDSLNISRESQKPRKLTHAERIYGVEDKK